MLSPVSTEASKDLIEPAKEPWGGLNVPPGWEPIARICKRVYEALSDLTESIVELVQQEIPDYRESSVPRPDLETSVFRNIEMMLAGIAEHRGPLAHELQVRSELGRRRARQGLPADSLLQAYHVGYRELWQALVAAAGDEDSSTQALLLSSVTTVWGWIQEVTAAVADAHHETTREYDIRLATLRQRLFDVLVSGEILSDEFGELARTLGFEPEGSFVAVCVRVGLDEGRRERVRREVESIDATLTVVRPHDVVVLLQDQDPAPVIAAIRSASPEAAIGLGSVRRGSMGARLSVGDAERAIAVTRDGETSLFEEVWLEASLVSGFDRLQELLRPGRKTAASNPELAETIVVFAESNFSLAKTARRLTVHPNTVTYRLDRWETLTGWDPRAFSGLTRSIASMRLRRPAGETIGTSST